MDSMPHRLVDRILLRDGAAEFRIFFPRSRNVTEITLTARTISQASAANQSFDRDFVQALSLHSCSIAKGLIQVIGHVADRVLHADIVGNVGI